LTDELKIKLKTALGRWNSPAPRKYTAEELMTLASADLIVVAGMGGITDAFRDWGVRSLRKNAVRSRFEEYRLP